VGISLNEASQCLGVRGEGEVMAKMTVDELNEWNREFELRVQIDPSVYPVLVTTLAEKWRVRTSLRYGPRLTPALNWFLYWIDTYGAEMLDKALIATSRKLRTKTLNPNSAKGVRMYTSGVLRKMAEQEAMDYPGEAKPVEDAGKPAAQPEKQAERRGSSRRTESRKKSS
jgi:hypothetical protein